MGVEAVDQVPDMDDQRRLLGGNAFRHFAEQRADTRLGILRGIPGIPENDEAPAVTLRTCRESLTAAEPVGGRPGLPARLRDSMHLRDPTT